MNTMYQINEKIIKNNLINLKQIVFEVTEKCNLNCKYCGLSDFYQKYDVRENRDLPFKKAKLIIDYLINLWNDNRITDANSKFAVSFYGGEPLMNIPLIKQIIDYIEQSKIAGKRIIYTMTSNAMLLDKHIDFLAAKNFNLLISLDGDEQSQSYRVDHAGNNSFNQVVCNVKSVQQKYPAYFKESIHFTSVLHNRNDVEPIIHFFKMHFDRIPRIVPLRNIGVCEDKKVEFWKMYQNRSQSLLKSLDCETIETEYFLDMPKGYRLTKHLYDASGNIFYNYNQLFLKKLINKEIYTGTCAPFSKKLFVTANGKILPCERIDYNFEAGYIHDDFVELNFQHIAEQHNAYLSKCGKQCIGCAINTFCSQCVYQIDNIREILPTCPSFCTKEAAEQEKGQIYSYLRQYPHYYEKVLNEVTISL